MGALFIVSLSFIIFFQACNSQNQVSAKEDFEKYVNQTNRTVESTNSSKPLINVAF